MASECIRSAMMPFVNTFVDSVTASVKPPRFFSDAERDKHTLDVTEKANEAMRALTVDNVKTGVQEALRHGIWKAIRLGDADGMDGELEQRCARAVQAMVLSGAKLNSDTSQGPSILMHVLKRGLSQIIKVVLDGGAKFSRNDWPTMTQVLSGADNWCLCELSDAAKERDLGMKKTKDTGDNAILIYLKTCIDDGFSLTDSKVTALIKLGIDPGATALDVMRDVVKPKLDRLKNKRRDFEENIILQTSGLYYPCVKKVLKLYQIGGLDAIEAFEADHTSREVTLMLRQYKDNKRSTRARIDDAGSHIRVVRD